MPSDRRGKLDRHRHALVERYMAGDMAGFEAARVSLCELIGKDSESTRKRKYIPQATRKHLAETIIEMRRLMHEGMPKADIGRMFHVKSRGNLHDILSSQTYKDVLT